MTDQAETPDLSKRAFDRLRRGMERTVEFFRKNQREDGHWVAELEGDALLQSETILLLAFLGEENSDLARRCAQRLEATMLPDGGWEMYPRAGADVTNSVKGYFALKLTGRSAASEPMRRTRDKVLAGGGAERVNSFTRFYLALLGQIPYSQTPAVPPQMIFLPKWFPINIYAMSSWSRTIFVPLSIVSALAPVKRIEPERGIRELMTTEPENWPPLVCPGRELTPGRLSWDAFFRSADRFLWRCRRWGLTPFRRWALQKAKVWTVRHFRKSDGPGAIYPPIVWAWIAFKAMGLADDSPEVTACRKEFEALVIDDGAQTRVAPCKSPVWDTVLAAKALRLAGVEADDSMMTRAETWLLDRQTTEPGDWRNNVKTSPGGWAFEYNNEYYPDCDDTAMALMVLGGSFPEGERNRPLLAGPPAAPRGEPIEPHRREDAIAAGRRWLRAMQNRDGGWAAFDRGNTRELLCRVPFADHNAMIDPSCPDLTGRVLESFARQGYHLRNGERFLRRTVRYLRRQQRPDGSWFGRWGVNYIYGTWQALTGLSAVGVPTDDDAVQAGARWLLSVQQSNGGWGESADSYRDESLKGKGSATASQTAWAVMGLIAAGEADSDAVRRGVEFLLDRQREDGRWDEPEFTGTGFPQVFYLRYHYYSVYFPLMALGLYAANLSSLAGRPNAAAFRSPTEQSAKQSAESNEKASSARLTLFRSEESDESETDDSDRAYLIPFRSESKPMFGAVTAIAGCPPLYLYEGDSVSASDEYGSEDYGPAEYVPAEIPFPLRIFVG